MADVPGHPFLKVGHALPENRQSLGVFVDRLDPFVDPFAEIFANPRTGRVDPILHSVKPPPKGVHYPPKTEIRSQDPVYDRYRRPINTIGPSTAGGSIRGRSGGAFYGRSGEVSSVISPAIPANRRLRSRNSHLRRLRCRIWEIRGPEREGDRECQRQDVQ